MKSTLENVKQTEPQQIAQNLTALLASHKLRTNELAQALDLPSMTIRRLISGVTTDPRVSTLKLIADHFDISIDTLINGDSTAFIKSSGKTKPQFIPLLRWNVAEKINSISELDLCTWEQWQPLSLGKNDKISKNAFALESRPSMYPRFPQGSIFIIDPDVNASDGDIVLIKIKENSELTLRELIIDPPEWHLHPIVSGSSVIEYNQSKHEIMGVNILTLMFNKKLSN